MEGVPVIDLGLDRPADARHRAEAARAIGRACETGGYFVAVGHGIAPETIEAIYAASARFFAEPDRFKTALTADPQDPVQRGYTWGDLEKYSICRLGEERPPGLPPITEEVLRIENRWPELPGFREAYLGFYAGLEGVALEVMRLFALALDLPESWFDDKFGDHMTQLAANHYLPNAQTMTTREFRNEPHQDWGTLTLLHQGDGYGGLEVLSADDEWLDVTARPDALVIHIGDLMTRWTNDRWKSCVHRVRQPPAEHAHRDRTTLAFFYQPSADTVIECIPTCTGPDDPPHHRPVESYRYITVKARRAFVVGRLAEVGRTTQQVGAARLEG